MNTPPIPHLYLHVPYCSGTCTYCTLYSQHYQPARAARYVDAVLHEIDLALAEGLRLAPETVFLGGGTPSVLEESLFERLLRGVRARFDPAHLTEWTLEAQPGTFTPAKLGVMRAVGVNRISLGVQALNDATLKRVARRHTVADVETTVATLLDAGFTNTGIDLIACLPDVTPTEWQATLAHAAALPLQHLSVYALTVEDGSILAEAAARGEFTPPDDDTQIAALETAEAVLTAAGYRRYEISNYARPGQECRHNLAYWRGRDFIGFGPAAASRLGRERWTNAPNTTAFTRALEAGQPPPRERETLSSQADRSERLVFGFRLGEGVEVTPFAEGDTALADHWHRTLTQLQGHGLAEPSGARWTLTPQGRLYADRIAEELLPEEV